VRKKLNSLYVRLKLCPSRENANPFIVFDGLPMS
jgi:hypothetical protein